MNTTKKITQDSKIVNVSKNKNVINFKFYKGQKESDILEGSGITTTCVISLDFSCVDNSQYIPII